VFVLIGLVDALAEGGGASYVIDRDLAAIDGDAMSKK
jgi:hypothetical protein